MPEAASLPLFPLHTVLVPGAALVHRAGEGDHVVFMSNGGFEGAPRRFLAALGG